MTDFDKLIKEKAEQAEYSYKPSAWRQFQRKTGMRSSMAFYWTVGLSSALVVGGVVAFFGYRHHNACPDAAPSQSMASVDTTQTLAPEIEEQTPETYLISETELATTKTQHAQGNHQVESAVDSATKLEHKSRTTHVANPPRYGRPLVIDVDTIKENVPTDEELKNGNSRLY